MKKFLKINNKIFYGLLIISILSAVTIFLFQIRVQSVLLAYTIGYVFIFFVLPLIAITLIIFIISNFQKFGFIKGIKESSINIFSLIIATLLVWGLWVYSIDVNNQINVKISNVTDVGISHITLIGRNAKTEIDSLAPNKSQTVVFKGRNINYKTDNDYENEVRLLYYYEKKWRENEILSGFNRWSVIHSDWEIIIHSADSIDLKQL